MISLNKYNKQQPYPGNNSKLLIPQSKKRGRFFYVWSYVRENSVLFLLAAPALVLVFAFSYIPMFGTVMAFEDYTPDKVFLSPFVGFRNFLMLFESPILGRLLFNTVFLNTLFIVCTNFFALTTALLLNELRIGYLKRILQSMMFLPFFMGWAIVAMVLFGLIDYQVGTINALLVALHLNRILITNDPAIWPYILAAIRVWNGIGSGSVIYLAVLIGVDPGLYEAAAMDGANRFRRMIHISLPSLEPVVILLVLLAIGKIFFGDFGMIYAVIGSKAQLYPTTDVIDTYIMRALQTNSNYGFIAAVGLIQSVLGFICVFGSNWLVKRYSQSRGENYSIF